VTSGAPARLFVDGIGLATPLGLGAAATLEGWLAGRSGIVPNDRFPADGLPRADAGLVPGFRPNRDLPDRKAVKLMSREAQLAVWAALEAAGGTGGDSAPQRFGVAPERVGAFAAAGYEVSELADVLEMLAAAKDPATGRLSLERLFGPARELYNPIAPIKTLPNMALFHVASALDLRGPHLALGSSPAAGLAALGEAAEALREGSCDAALALGCDAQVEAFRTQLLVEAGVMPGLAPAEGAAALLLRRDAGATGVAHGRRVRLVAWGAGQAQGGGDGARDSGGSGASALWNRTFWPVVRRTLDEAREAGAPEVSLCFVDPARAAGVRQGGPASARGVISAHERWGWLGAAGGLCEAALAVLLIRAGHAESVLVSAIGLAGDVAAVVLAAEGGGSA
jgi:3-oxoacyl-(acyl-carrier-protein) synthase